MMTNQSKIFQLLTKIPKGKVTTYKLLAQAAGLASPRLAGSIIHQNTDTKIFPCHRVVRSNGTLATGYAFGGAKAQKKLLQQEGIVFQKNKMHLASYLFSPKP